MKKPKSSFGKKSLALVLHVLKFLGFSILIILISLVFLLGAYKLLGNKPEFYIDGKSFDSVEQSIQNGSVEVETNKSVSLQMTGGDYSVSIESPTYLKINEEIIIDDSSQDSQAKPITLRLSKDWGWLYIGAWTIEDSWTTPNAKDWHINTSINNSDMKCMHFKTNDKGMTDTLIYSSKHNEDFSFFSSIQQGKDIYTAIKERTPYSEDDTFKCELWFDYSTNIKDKEPDLIIDNVSMLLLKSNSKVYLSGETDSYSFDDDLDDPIKEDLFDEKNYFNVSIQNVSSVKIQNMDGEIYQYIGEDLVTNKSLRETVSANGTFNSSWLLKDGVSKYEVSGIPDGIFVSDKSIKANFIMWLRCNSTAIAVMIIGAILGGISFAGKKKND